MANYISKGCYPANQCPTSSLSTSYTTSIYCCDGDLCNRSTSKHGLVSMPFVALLLAVVRFLTTIAHQWTNTRTKTRYFFSNFKFYQTSSSIKPTKIIFYFKDKQIFFTITIILFQLLFKIKLFSIFFYKLNKKYIIKF